MRWLKSWCSSTVPCSSGSQKLGQPVPDSNLVSEANRPAPQAAHRYTPSECSSQYAPVKGRSVPFSRSTWYCSGVSSWRHCSSLFVILLLIGPPRPRSPRATAHAAPAFPDAGRAAPQMRSGPLPEWERRSADRPDVGRLGALGALGHLELDLLVLLEVPVAHACDRAEMHEHVWTTVVLGDEPEALLAVEPLHDTGAHEQSLPSCPPRA